MSLIKSARMQNHFAELTDPRRREVTYPLINVVVIAVCAVICGADDFVALHITNLGIHSSSSQLCSL